MLGRDMKGLIFDVQHFCVHDGPGIRTVVFFKGCPLRCIWCCNPESQNMFPELIFDEEKCIKCLKCTSCQKGAIIFDSCIKIDRQLCNACGECEDICPTNALKIVGQFLDAKTVVEEILEDRVFYGKKGGVTFSGGEPLMQNEFLLELSKLSQMEELNVAVETSGYAKWPIIEKILRYVDVFLFDVKAIDPESHLLLTGVDNKLILENLKKIAKESEVVVRCAVVEGYNFKSEEDAVKLAEICRNVGVERIDLLKYHRFGEKKYRMLGREFDLRVSETGLIYRMRDLLKNDGFAVSVGGLI